MKLRSQYRYLLFIFLNLVLFVFISKADKSNKIVSFSADSLEYYKEEPRIKKGLKERNHEPERKEGEAEERKEGETIESREINKLKGNVIFLKQGLRIRADEAEYEEQKKIEAKGNIVIEKTRNDGTKIKILTDSLTYYVDREVAEFQNKVTLIDGKNILNSDVGEYNDAEDTANFYGNVRVDSDEQIVNCDILSYKTIDDNILKNHKELFENLKISVEQKKKIYLAEGVVDIAVKKEKMNIKSDYCAYYKDEERIKLYGRPILKKTIKNDDFYLYADIIIIQKDEDSDEKSEKKLRAYGNVNLYNKELRAKSNEIKYIPSKNVILFGVNSIFWTEDSQLIADEAKLIIEKENVKEMHLNYRALIIQKDEYKNFNQIKGENIKMLFNDNKIYHMIVEGEAQSIQFLSNEQDKGLIGVNHIKCEKIKIDLKDNKAKKVNFLGKNYTDMLKGFMMAPKNSNPKNSRFMGFSWRPNEKPSFKEVKNLLYDRSPNKTGK